ncbi:hypothetical protein Q1695_016454 [Nippostrongylus brasiliensis]|nr:hypothetical protein Q1695_016454 [Nippostrongylus brasiliensis]
MKCKASDLLRRAAYLESISTNSLLELVIPQCSLIRDSTLVFVRIFHHSGSSESASKEDDEMKCRANSANKPKKGTTSKERRAKSYV